MALLNLGAWLLVIGAAVMLAAYLCAGVLAFALRVFERPHMVFITLLVRLLELPFKLTDRIVKAVATARQRKRAAAA